MGAMASRGGFTLHSQCDPSPGSSRRDFVLPAYESRLGFGDPEERGNRAGLARWITGREETRFRELGLDATRRHARERGPDGWYELCFEGLVADPEAQLWWLCGYLGEEYVSGTREP